MGRPKSNILPPRKWAIRQAIEQCGGAMQGLGDELGCTRQAISLWLKGGTVSEEFADKLVKLTGLDYEVFRRRKRGER